MYKKSTIACIFDTMRPIILHKWVLGWGFFPILLLAVTSLYGQEVPRTIHFNKKDYDAQSQNWMIAQSPDGLMYFANSGGLLSFDGSHWALLQLPGRQIVRSVATDRFGNIFTGAFGEFGYWHSSGDGTLVYHSLSKQIKLDKTAKEEIWHILVRDDRVFFQSFSTIYKYDYKDVSVVTPPGNIMFLYPAGNEMRIQVIEKGIYHLKEDLTFQWTEGSQFFSGKIVASILPADHGDFLVGTTHEGIFLKKSEVFTPWNEGLNQVLKEFQLNKGIRLRNGNYAFGTILNGVYLTDSQGNILYHINQENGLQNNTVLSLMEDQSYNLWVGLDKGIDLVEINSPLTFYLDKSGRIGTVYTASINKDRLYLGTNQGVFWRDLQSPGGSAATFHLLTGTQGQVWELQVLDNQLVCGHNSGTFIIDGLQLTRISEITGGWCTRKHPRLPGVLVQGTYTGLAIFMKDAKGKWKFSHKVEGYSEPTRGIEIDQQGNIWAINPYNGIYYLQLDETLHKVIHIQGVQSPTHHSTHFKAKVNKISSDTLIVFADSLLCYASGKGLLSVYPFQSAKNGLSNLIHGQSGVSFEVFPNQVIMKQQNKNIALYLSLLPDNENIIILDEHRYLFCLDDGYAIYDNLIETRQMPALNKPLISKIEIVGKGSLIYPFRTKEKERPYTFPSGSNHLRISYSIPEYTRKPKFRTQLQGFSSEWSDWEYISVKEFTNIPPGAYTLMVQSDDSEEISQFKFTIKPYWYESMWMYMVYMILLGGIIYLLLRLHQHRLDEQQKQLEEEKNKELLQQSIRNANEKLHFDVINKSKELANSTMSLIHKNEVLLEIKDALNKIKSELGSRLPEKYYSKLSDLIDDNISNEHDLYVFETNFNEVHEVFLKKLKTEFPELTPGDLRLAAYLKMNLTSKEIAPLLNISIRGLENKRYRLRKKMGLSEEENLSAFLMNY